MRASKLESSPVTGDKRLIDKKEAIRLLSISQSTLERYVAAEKLPEGAVVKLGRLVRFDRLVLLRWIDDGCRLRTTGARRSR